MMRVIGLQRLQSRFDQMIAKTEKRVVDLRKQVAAELIEALIENTPVWSGATVRSIQVTNSSSLGNRGEPHHDRRDYAKNGEWVDHKLDFGDTINMPLGPERNRPSAEAIARASVNAVKYGMDERVFVDSDSYKWDIIDDATYNGNLSRNKAVVSALAVAQVKAKFGKVIQ